MEEMWPTNLHQFIAQQENVMLEGYVKEMATNLGQGI